MFALHCTLGDFAVTLVRSYKHPDIVIKSHQCCNNVWPTYNPCMLDTQRWDTLLRKIDLIASENTHQSAYICNIFANMRLLFFQRYRMRNVGTLITKHHSFKKCWKNWWLRIVFPTAFKSLYMSWLQICWTSCTS